MKKFSKRIFVSLMCLLFSFAALSSSTYAWFSMNKIATVKGMEIKATTDSDMLIGKLSEVATDTAIDVTSKHFKTSLDVSADDPVVIASASSIDGINFYKAIGAINGRGEVEGTADIYEAVTNPTDITETHYYAQWDYVVKYVNTTDDDQTVDVTQLELKYNGTVDPSRAFRVAFIVTPCTTTVTNNVVTAATIDGTATSKGIYKHSESEYFTSGKAANSATTLGKVTDISATLFDCPANATTFVKISVVLWLEGEDSTCRSDVFANLTESWMFGFKIARTGVTGETKVTELTLSVN